MQQYFDINIQIATPVGVSAMRSAPRRWTLDFKKVLYLCIYACIMLKLFHERKEVLCACVIYVVLVPKVLLSKRALLVTN